MALEQRKTTRWAARVGMWVAKAIQPVLDVLKSFLSVKESDGILVGGKKTANLLVRKIAYFFADYYLVGVSASIVSTMKYLGFSFSLTFVALWIFDVIVAGAFLILYERTGEDLSLGEDYRRAVDTIYTKSRLAGHAALLMFIAKATYWTGPEKVVTFFRKEIGSAYRVGIVLLILTAIQSLIWTPIYGLGYDLLAK